MKVERHRVNLISTEPNALDLIGALERLKLQVQVAGDYKGRFPSRVFTSVTPVALESIVPTAISLTEEKRVDWHSPEVVSEILGQAMNRQSLFTRLITTMLDQPGAESEKGFRILNEDLRRFQPDPSIFNDSRFEEWWFRFLLTFQIESLIAFRAAFDHGETSPEAKNLLETTEAQMEIFKATLTSLELKDLPSYLRFADLYAQSQAVTQGGHSQPFYKIYKNAGRKSTLAGLILPRLEERLKQSTVLDKGLHEEDFATWARLRVGWNWEQVQDALATLPTLGSQFVIAHAITALQVNLEHLAEEGGQDEIELSPAGLALLLKFDLGTVIRETKTPQDEHSAFSEELQKTFGPSDPLVAKRLPVTAINLLNNACGGYSESRFKQLLSDVQVLVQADESLTMPWLLTLLFLKEGRPQIQELIEDFFGSWENLPEEMRRILLNQSSGRIFLTPEGRLRVKEPGESFRGSSVFTSSVPPPPAAQEERQEKRSEVRPTPEKERKEVVVEEILVLPFLGEVGLVGQDEIKTLLFSPNGIPTNEDKLLEDFINLARHWKDTFRRERHLLYLLHLNPQDKNFEEAKRLFGITAVYIEQEKFIFVLDKERLSAQIDGRSLPAGFQGKLDETGQLHVLGMDVSFLGEPEQLFLNNLTLQLTTQSFYNWGADKERDHEVRRAAHEIVAGWNRSGRNSLPKIELNPSQNNQNSFCLPIRLAGYKEPVSVCELPK